MRLPPPSTGMPWVTHILRHILRRVKDGIHRVDMCKLHETAVGQLAALVELAAPIAGAEDVEGRHPHAEADLGAGLRQVLGDGPTKALVVGHAGDESLLSAKVDAEARALRVQLSGRKLA